MKASTLMRGYLTMRYLALSLGLIFMTLSIIKGHAFPFEFEFRGPEWHNLEDQVRDDENSQCWDRVQEGSTDPQDLQGARDFWSDHGA